MPAFPSASGGSVVGVGGSASAGKCCRDKVNVTLSVVAKLIADEDTIVPGELSDLADLLVTNIEENCVDRTVVSD